jgi:transcriptional regulator with XRE-family HTH domain
MKSEVPELPELISRLRKATAERGMKAKLARAMGVLPPRISEWLAKKNSKEPSGQTTLRLLQFVLDRESQLKNSGSVSAPPERKTRSTQISYEKRKPSPPKA